MSEGWSSVFRSSIMMSVGRFALVDLRGNPVLIPLELFSLREFLKMDTGLPGSFLKTMYLCFKFAALGLSIDV